MSLTPIYRIGDLAAPVLDEAVNTICPKENVLWELTYVMINTQYGPQPTGLLILSMPSPILGTGDIVLTATLNARELTERSTAFDHVRNMVEMLRQQRAQMLNPQANN